MSQRESQSPQHTSHEAPRAETHRASGAAASKRSLDIIRVEDPCTVDWDTMLCSGAVRYCRLCKQNVYNLSDMSREEAEELVFAGEGKVCVRFYRRADGSVMTTDCAPTRAERARRAARRALKSVAALMAMGLGVFTTFRVFSGEEPKGKGCTTGLDDKYGDPEIPVEVMGEPMYEPAIREPIIQQPPAPAVEEPGEVFMGDLEFEPVPDPEIPVERLHPRMGRIRLRR